MTTRKMYILGFLVLSFICLFMSYIHLLVQNEEIKTYRSQSDNRQKEILNNMIGMCKRLINADSSYNKDNTLYKLESIRDSLVSDSTKYYDQKYSKKILNIIDTSKSLEGFKPNFNESNINLLIETIGYLISECNNRENNNNLIKIILDDIAAVGNDSIYLRLLTICNVDDILIYDNYIKITDSNGNIVSHRYKFPFTGNPANLAVIIRNPVTKDTKKYVYKAN